MTVDEIREYQQIRTPDYAAIANYVLQAKGPDRTMAQFAEETQIGASTLSRIINRVSKKPLSVDTIITIFEHRADPDNLYLLEALARANGLVRKDFAEKAQNRESIQARRNEEINRELMMKNALVAGVVACGMPIKGVLTRPMMDRTPSPIFPMMCGDFAITLDESRMISPYHSWTFFLYPDLWDSESTTHWRSTKNLIRHRVAHVFPWLLADAWIPEELKGTKFSFAFIDEAIFYEFIDAMKIANLHTEMTAILMHPENYSVIKEVWLPGAYQQISNISIFEVPAPLPTEEQYYDEMDDIYKNDMEDTE